VEAELFERDADVWIRRRCPLHGEAEHLYWKDRRLFQRVESVVGDHSECVPPRCSRGEPCREHLSEDRVAQIMVHLTDRCNFNCPICFADAGTGRDDALDADRILERLPPAGRFRRPPHVVFIGGEPTLHGDLPRLIREVRRRGFVPRLATNGLRLLDEAYLNELVAAGLRWVVVQFDGLDDRVNARLRGRNLAGIRARLVPALRSRGIKVQFAVMVVRGVNDGELEGILDYSFSHGVFWVSLYPFSHQNRCGADLTETHIADVLNALEEQTGGAITADDAVEMMRLWSFLYRLTGNRVFRQKRTTVPMVLVKDGGKVIPVSRLFRPSQLARHPLVPVRLLRDLARIVDFDHREPPDYLRYLVIRKFHAEQALDLVEAARCHMAYVSDDSFVPFDIFHIVSRNAGGSDAERGQSSARATLTR
jgi:uncharacterized radical SAM superfamily Fe-S cluster-containing enzyme